MAAHARIRQHGNVVRFGLIHIAALSVFVVPFQWAHVWWLAGSYVVRMFAITAGYHRYLLATVLLYHATFAINSVAHVWGTRPYPTADDSRNNFLLALLTLGEGWHNNHHYCRSSCRQGVRWWEIDLTYLGLRALAAFGIARDLRPFVAYEGRQAA